MATVEKSIDVNVPAQVAYDQWTEFEEFPVFMEGVKEARQLDDTHLHWCADIGGVEKEWDAEITEQIPDRRIAWHSVSGAANGGIVSFQGAGNEIHIQARMDYDPKGLVENAGDAMGFVSRRVEGDLERFKDFLESRDRETGAWRGTV